MTHLIKSVNFGKTKTSNLHQNVSLLFDISVFTIKFTARFTPLLRVILILVGSNLSPNWRAESFHIK